MGWGSLFSGANSPFSVLLILLGIVLGLVAYGVRRLVDGRLVPRRVLEDARESFDQRLQREREISEAQRLANENIVAALKNQTEQMQMLIREQQLVRDVMISLRRVGETSPTRDVTVVPLPGSDVA
jgi:hypothetical protein